MKDWKATKWETLDFFDRKCITISCFLREVAVYHGGIHELPTIQAAWNTSLGLFKFICGNWGPKDGKYSVFRIQVHILNFYNHLIVVYVLN